MYFIKEKSIIFMISVSFRSPKSTMQNVQNNSMNYVSVNILPLKYIFHGIENCP